MSCFGWQRGSKNAVADIGTTAPGQAIDPFVKSEKVYALNSANFRSTLKDKAIAMVMFYEKTDPHSSWSRKHFKKASQITKRPGHMYGAIDCDKDEDFCVNAGLQGIPDFKIYVKGEDVGFGSDARNLRYEEMNKWVEGFPVPTPPDTD